MQVDAGETRGRGGEAPRPHIRIFPLKSSEYNNFSRKSPKHNYYKNPLKQSLMGGWRDEPKMLTRGDGGMEGIPPRPGTAMKLGDGDLVFVAKETKKEPTC